MKPQAILLTIVLGLVSLSIVVWVGQYKAGGLIKTPNSPLKETTADDLPVPKAGPFGKAEIEETEYDFGVKIAGSQDRHTFTIKNVGKGVLELKLGKPTCQCTVGEITKVSDSSEGDKIEPGKPVSLKEGESVNIVVKWVMKTFNEAFRQSVPVFTTDPDLRQIDLAIRGSIDNPIHLVPGGFWDLGELSRTTPSRAEGFAYSTAVDEFTLTEVPRTNSLTKVTIEPASKEELEAKEAKSGYKISVEIPPNVPVGLFRENIRLSAFIANPFLERDDAGNIIVAKPDGAEGDKKEGEAKEGEKPTDQSRVEMYLDFSIAGKRSGPIEVRSPSGGIAFNPNSNRVIFGEFRASEGKKGALLIYPKGMTEDLQLISVEPVNERISVKLVPGKSVGKAKGYQLDIEILPGPPMKQLAETAAEVNLKLNHPEVPDFKLLIDYNAKP